MTLEEIFGIAGRTAVVTGGGSGLGKGMASALAAAGANIVLVDVQRELAEAAACELSERGTKALALLGDVTDGAFLAETLSRVLERFGRADILVCAAGRPLRKGALESTDADFDALMAVNVKAVFQDEMKREPGRIERDVARIPAGRLGQPKDLAGAVLLLASDAGQYIVGQTLIVDGGWTIY